MTYVCPKCQSPRIKCNDYAKKIGALIGAVAGVLSVTSQAGRYTMGAVSRLVVGRFPIPPIGDTASIIVNALIAGTAGGAAGTRLGQFLDSQILRNFRCLDCKHKFSENDFVQEEEDDPRAAWMYRQYLQQLREQGHPGHRVPQTWQAGGLGEDE